MTSARQSIVITTGGPGGALYPLAQSLVHLYAKTFPDFSIKLSAVGSSGTVDALQRGTAELGFVQADIAYVAYSRGTATNPSPYRRLRGVAVLWSNTAQIVVPRNSPIQSISDLRGKRVGVGAAGTSTDVLARIILKAYGLRYADIHPVVSGFADRAKQLRAGQIDAAFVTTGLPAPVVQDLNANPGIRLLPVDRNRIDALRGEYPFLRPVVVPRGTYRGQTDDVPAVGVDDLLVCRSDLNDDLVYRLTKAFFDSLPSLAASYRVAATVDLDQAPGTPIPLHPGAARYYREREIAP